MRIPLHHCTISYASSEHRQVFKKVTLNSITINHNVTANGYKSVRSATELVDKSKKTVNKSYFFFF